MSSFQMSNQLYVNRFHKWQGYVLQILPRLIATTATAPFEVLSTLQSLQTPVVSDDIYIGTKAAVTLYRQEGWKAFWKGNLVQLEKTFFFQVIQLSIARLFKNWPRLKPSPISRFLQTIPSAFGAVVATLITYPAQVIHVRFIQQSLNEPKYKGIVETFKTIVKEEGVCSFYRGIVFDLLELFPLAILFHWWPQIFQRLCPNIRSNLVRSVALSVVLQELLLPYDNLKNKLMAAKGSTLPKSMTMNVEVTSLRSAFTNTIQHSGFLSLWSGLLSSTLHSISFVLVKSFVAEAIERFFLWLNGYTKSPLTKKPRIGVPQHMTPKELKVWYQEHPDL